MTLAANYEPISYAGVGTASPLAVPFRFLNNADLIVTARTGGVPTVLTIGSNYTVTGAGSSSGGEVTPLSTIPVGTTWTIERQSAREQETDFVDGNDFPAEAHENALDRGIMIAQEQDVEAAEIKSRALLVPFGEAAPVLDSLAALITGDILQYRAGKIGRADFLSSASKFVAFDSLGHLVGVDGSLPDSVPALASNIVADGGDSVQQELDRAVQAYASVAALKAASAGRLAYHLVAGGALDGNFHYETADAPYTADDIDIFKLDDVALSVGALVRRTASDLATTVDNVQADLDRRYTKTEADAIHAEKPIVQGKGRINYASASSVSIEVPEAIAMGGMRIAGSYRKGAGKAFATAINGKASVSFSTDLAHQTTRNYDNWYEFFAVANDGDANCIFKAVPYLTVKGVAGLVVTLGLNGEGKDPNLAATYDWPVDALAGAEVLLIEEGFTKSRRMVACTANTTTTITLDDVGALAQGDRILVMPNGWDNYASLGAHYLDVAEPRNIADMVTQTHSLMSVNIANLPAAGAVATPLEISLRSYIPPLAEGAIIAIDLTISTTSLGDFAHYLWHDSSSHEFTKEYEYKSGTSNWPISDNQIFVPFSGRQSFYYSTAGALPASVVSRTAQVRGWVSG